MRVTTSNFGHEFLLSPMRASEKKSNTSLSSLLRKPFLSSFQGREKKSTKLENSGVSAEELQRNQEALFAGAKARFDATST